jgi:hypothetical protein
MLQYLFTGSKKDYKKILLDKDKKDCIEFDEDGNRFVKCKKHGGNGNYNQNGGNLIEGCDKSDIKFKINDRVLVTIEDNEIDINRNASYIEEEGTKWFIGTVIGVKEDNYSIQIDNGGISVTDHDSIRVYDNDWNDFYDELHKLPDLKEIRKNRDKDEEQLVVIDDWIAEIHKYPKIVDFAIRCRKCNITFVFIAQSYFKIPKPIRSQMTYLILLKVSSGKDLRLIMGDFNLVLELDQLQNIYKDATKIKMKDFMKIDVNSGDPNKKFSKNWKDFYEVEKTESIEKS